jgi:hypothetical protein
MKAHKVNPAECPYCFTVQDRATEVTGESKGPSENDISICVDCGGVSVFDERLEPRIPDGEEMEKIMEIPEVRIGVELIKMRFGRREGDKGNEIRRP